MTKLKLTIKRADNSVYWVEHFDSQNDLDKWLAVEMTRPYWNSEFTTETLDITPPPLTQDQLNAIATRKAAIETLKNRLNDLDGLNDLTAAELKEMARKFFKLLKLKGFVD
jgi:hypothetical protein